MKRNQLTTAGLLQPGDVFYRAADKSKTVLVRVAAEAKKTAYATYSVAARKPGARYAEHLKSNTPVVFLRKQAPEA